VTEPSPDPATGAVDHRLSAIPPAARGLQGRRAGLVSRLLANTVDFCIVALVVAAGYAGAAALRFLWNSRTFTFPAPGFGVLVIVGGVVMVLYLAACWTATGRTYGDHLLGLRVVSSTGGSGGYAARVVVPGDVPVGIPTALTADVAAACTKLVKIPMSGRLDSLNLAIATALMLYQVRGPHLKL